MTDSAIGGVPTPGTDAAGDGSHDTHDGVTPAEAPGSGFSAYEPSGGLTGAGVALFLAVPVGERFGVGGFVNYERRLGDVKDSPLVDGADVWRAGVIGVVRFSSPN